MPLEIKDKSELLRKKYYPERRSAVRIKKWAAKLCGEEKPIWLSMKVAEKKEELESSYKLLYDVYLEKGYMDEQPHGMRISIYNALPHTITFLALDSSDRGNKIIGTISLIMDSSLGLPMEEVFKEEIKLLRNSCLKIAEVSGLAVDTNYRYERVFMYLNQFLVAFALFVGVTDLVITVNPKHVNFYNNILFFKPMGPERRYSKVKGAPAVPMHLNLKETEEKIKSLYSYNDFDASLYTFFFTRTHFVLQEKNNGNFSKEIMTPETLSYFFVEKTDIFKKATNYQMRQICYYYPKYNFCKIFKKDKTLLKKFFS